MDTIEALGSIAEKVKTQKDGIETEEATKNAFVMATMYSTPMKLSRSSPQISELKRVKKSIMQS